MLVVYLFLSVVAIILLTVRYKVHPFIALFLVAVVYGVVAGLLAQGLSVWQAAVAGVYLHGRAGDLAAEKGERGMMAGDLLEPLRFLANPPASR